MGGVTEGDVYDTMTALYRTMQARPALGARAAAVTVG
jgi:hypothetical protein